MKLGMSNAVAARCKHLHQLSTQPDEVSSITLIVKACVGKSNIVVAEAIIGGILAERVIHKPYLNARILPEELAYLVTLLRQVGENHLHHRKVILAVTRTQR
ncbi:MAG: hypothetical protein R2856_01480 [Caldilineaceae bacterium]